MKIKIACDSSADLTPELIKQNDISILPFTVTMGEVDYKDGVDVDAQAIFDYVEKSKTLPKTASLNQFEYTEFFNQIKEDNDAIIFFSISSQISSTYNNAVRAAEEVGNVFVIDSLNLTSGISLLILYASELRAKGLSPEEIVKKVEERRPAIQTSFITYKLDYLHKGGRCSSLALLGANLLKIRPSIALINGKMQMHKKYMGKPIKVDLDYLKDTLKEFNNPDNKYCFITYSSITPDILKMFKTHVKENTKFENIYETHASATITSHCGENTIGLIYFNDGNQTE